MMPLLDDDDFEERKKEQMLGNMFLITELHVHKLISATIIKTCIDDLKTEINDQNIEALCVMLNRLMSHLYQVEVDRSPDQKRGNLKDMTIEYCDGVAKWLF
jgi:hypothetical protein